MDLTVEATLESEIVSRKHPRVEDFISTLKVFVKNRIALAGLIIVVIYAIIAILDWVYPAYLGIKSGFDLSDALVTFHMSTYLGKPILYPSPITGSLIPFTIGVSYGVPPYGSGAIITLIPPTLHGPTNTPGWWWIFGSTAYNLPIFPVMLASLKWDLTYTVVIVLIGAAIGTIVGTFAGFYGGATDEAIMRVTDIFFSIPFLVLAMAILYVMGVSINNVLLALIIIWWPIYARLTRGQALSVKANKFVEAATASGSSRIRTMFVHILPNVLAPVFVQISLDLGTVIALFATLDFLGFHYTSIYLPELGNMITWGDQTRYLFATPMNWWPFLIPALFLVIFTIAVNLLGDGLRDVLDPKLRR